jgi:hypothetical protein
MFQRVSLLGACLLCLYGATPATADPITWIASDQVSSVSGPAAQPGRWPGLEVGTPWSLAVTFDPNSAPSNVRSGFPGCNRYSGVSSTLTIGPYTYQSSSGTIYTEAGFPDFGCEVTVTTNPPIRLDGLIQFVLRDWRSDDPNAWNFPMFSPSLTAGYYDLLANDGTLPTVPTYDPTQGTFSYTWMLWFSSFPQGLFGMGQPQFQVAPAQPAPVPEPGTLTLLGIGLAAAARRARARHKKTR